MLSRAGPVGRHVRDGLSEGMWMGGTVPIGYDIVDRRRILCLRSGPRAQALGAIPQRSWGERSIESTLSRMAWITLDLVLNGSYPIVAGRRTGQAVRHQSYLLFEVRLPMRSNSLG